MNFGRSPEWVLTTHAPNELANLEGHCRSSGTGVMTLPGPKQTKAFMLPSNHRGGFDQPNSYPPTGPVMRQPHPEPAIQSAQPRSLYRTLQNGELMTQSESFDLKRNPAAKRRS